ncbi:hypothetical protein EST38_g9499 [Candolleomyces aberdarensis]|uniref:Calcineurin-like phosphoesterase domain-containing protein n=1 Tax=Candolleomyces aberdarensis TaxID=2316362 RepID=A0A4Q2DCP2_9AGAR|nr:hypothetical protein EST38_g9499 [Candolleomyces aberdarensis]
MDALFNREPPTPWEQFQSSPLEFLARLLYEPPSPSQLGRAGDPNAIRVVCISDTHNSHNKQPPLPEGDILIHSGDFTNNSTQAELDSVLTWLEAQSHPHKLFIAGNHDAELLSGPDIRNYISATYPGLTYLQDTSTSIDIRGRTLRVYGSPHTPKHGSWQFQYPRVESQSYDSNSESEAAEIWSQIPPATDILVTHGPPFGHLSFKSGCYALLMAVWHVRPRLHVFGHIHAGRGIEVVPWNGAQGAYEDICAGRVGFLGALLKLLVLGWSRVWTQWFAVDLADATIMVNAASVSGDRDSVLKGALMVDI